MYYIGFLKKDARHAMVFRSIVKPKKDDLTYFVKVIGPYPEKWEAERTLRDLKHVGWHENPVRESVAKYCRERQIDPRKFAKGSFRTIPLGHGKKGVIGCIKGKYHRGRCGVGTKLQTILHPVGAKGCKVGGTELQKRKRNLMTDRQALALTKKVVAYGKKLMKHEKAEIRRGRMNNPADSHLQKFLQHVKTLEKYAVGSKEYIDKLAVAYGHLKAAKEAMGK
jgi:hypothetical protein